MVCLRKDFWFTFACTITTCSNIDYDKKIRVVKRQIYPVSSQKHKYNEENSISNESWVKSRVVKQNMNLSVLDEETFSVIKKSK